VTPPGAATGNDGQGNQPPPQGNFIAGGPGAGAAAGACLLNPACAIPVLLGLGGAYILGVAVADVINDAINDGVQKAEEYKVPKPGSGKERADDIPSWARGQRPKVGEAGKDFAKRLLDQKYGPDQYPKGPGSEFDKIRKHGDRGFQDP